MSNSSEPIDLTQNNEIYEIIESFNNKVIQAHNAHCDEKGNSMLIKRNEAPNANTIYHFYSSGEITFQKGGDVYGLRTEFNSAYDLGGARKYPFKFKFSAMDNTTYVILTERECQEFRDEMEQIISECVNI